jgi:hypothetical protein
MPAQQSSRGEDHARPAEMTAGQQPGHRAQGRSASPGHPRGPLPAAGARRPGEGGSGSRRPLRGLAGRAGQSTRARGDPGHALRLQALYQGSWCLSRWISAPGGLTAPEVEAVTCYCDVRAARGLTKPRSGGIRHGRRSCSVSGWTAAHPKTAGMADSSDRSLIRHRCRGRA